LEKARKLTGPWFNSTILVLMKLLAWNIQQGGGNRADNIVDAICNHDSDAIALIEFRTASGKELLEKLKGKGWKYPESTTPMGNDNGLCVLSRTPLLRRPNPPVPSESVVRWIDADLPAYGFGIGVLHIPGARPKPNERRGAVKSRFWDAVTSAAQSRRDEPFIIIGDLNTGALIDGKRFVCAEHFGRMTQELGWIDLWRAFNEDTPKTESFSWYSKRKGGADRNGFRVDHAFASPALWPRVVGCRYSHVEREARTSDHSILVVEIPDL
jgi:exonuclease III